MKETAKEIKNILEAYASKKKDASINIDKLMGFFENAALSYPEKDGDREFSLSEYSFKKKFTEKTRRNINLTDFLSRPVFAGIAAVLVIVFAFALKYSIFTPPAEQGAAYAVTGNVKIIRGNRTLYLTNGTPVVQGDVLFAENDSSADVTINDFVRFRINKNSEIILDTVALDTSRSIAMTLAKGVAYFHVMKLNQNDSVAVGTPVSSCEVRGTVFTVEYSGNQARYDVFEGKVKVKRLINDAVKGDDKAIVYRDDSRKQSLILEEGTSCLVRGTDFSGRQKLPGLVKGVIAADKKAASSGVMDFVIGIGAQDGTFNLVPVMVQVTPANASIIVDGQEKKHGSVYITKGKHHFDISADGYKNKSFDVDIMDQLQKVAIKLDAKKNPYYTWVSHLQSEYIFYNPTRGQLVTVDDQCLIAATDLKEIKWSIDFNKKLSGMPYYSDNILYVTTADGMIAACDCNRGRIVWERHLDGPVKGSMSMANFGRNLFVVTDKATVYKIDLMGNKVWEKNLPLSIAVPPFVRGTTLFLALEKGWLIGLNSETGAEKRKVLFNDEISAMTVSNDAVYLASKSGNIYNYNYSGDTIEWTYASKKAGRSSLSVDEKSVYVLYSNGYFARLNLSGRPMWERELGTSVAPRYAEDSRNFYFTSDNTIFVVARDSGEVLWSLAVPSILTEKIAVSENKMYLVSSKKGLIVLNKI
ncbi:MAG TPA: PQQ-binding-like beta-propeller repeat protein [Spirochaetota bacterium]|nr:PQQ-binding-like beta-propeller repeat protein [Spirochaetota bacterium]HPI89671.1 PQQ-binding-like beta-propeller repeat protein [Spirochaetota bacterium]HPR49503.1 PQQ-binding-like beta-propeller repeat protein [Spirochaetota bacterium]